MARHMKGQGKLGAYITNGGKKWDADEAENVLYLGAAQGVTARWMAHLVPQGRILAVEKSPVASIGLIRQAREQANILPYVGDARRPETFAPAVPELGLLYQDVAQRDQVDIFLRNAATFQPRRGFLAVKARSIAVERDPTEVIQEAAEQVQGPGDIVDVVRLDPYHKDHAMIVADFREDR